MVEIFCELRHSYAVVVILLQVFLGMCSTLGSQFVLFCKSYVFVYGWICHWILSLVDCVQLWLNLSLDFKVLLILCDWKFVQSILLSILMCLEHFYDM
jgi:hypothetical protein